MTVVSFVLFFGAMAEILRILTVFPIGYSLVAEWKIKSHRGIGNELKQSLYI